MNIGAAGWTAAITLALAATPTVARAQQQGPPGPGTPPPATTLPSQPGGSQATGPDTTMGGASDVNARQNDQHEFLEKAAIANMAEIQLGQLAEERAQDPQVKQFAQTMVTEHKQALDELKQAAGSMQVPSELDKKHQKLQDKLSKLNGAEFDREYMKAMVDAHKDAAKLLERETKSRSASAAAPSGASVGTSGATSTATTGTSGTTAASAGGSGLSEWASSTLPKVQSHLDHAKQIQDSLKSAQKGNSSTTPAAGTGTSGTPGTSGTGNNGSGSTGSSGSGSGAGSGSGSGSGTGSGGGQ